MLSVLTKQHNIIKKLALEIWLRKIPNPYSAGIQVILEEICTSVPCQHIETQGLGEKKATTKENIQSYFSPHFSL